MGTRDEEARGTYGYVLTYLLFVGPTEVQVIRNATVEVAPWVTTVPCDASSTVQFPAMSESTTV